MSRADKTLLSWSPVPVWGRHDKTRCYMVMQKKEVLGEILKSARGIGCSRGVSGGSNLEK